MLLRPSLTKMILLFIVLPVLIEMTFVVVLLREFDQLQQEYLREAHAVDAVIEVNAILGDYMTTCSTLMLFASEHDKSMLTEAVMNVENITHHGEQLEADTRDDNIPEVQRFIATTEAALKYVDMTSGEVMETGALDFNNVETMSMARNLMRRMRVTGSKVIEREAAIRAESREKSKKNVANIQFLMEVAALVNMALAVFFATLFVLTLGRKFHLLTDNTIRISLGKPLNPPLKGTDELAQLDQVLHNLSSELADTRERERALLDNTADIICSLDESGRVNEVNNAIAIRMGYPADEFRGSLFQSYVHADDREDAYNQLMRCEFDKREMTFEVRMKDAYDRYRFMEVTADWSAQKKNIFCVIRDISERKEAERLRQDVLAMVSHDLRAPLSSIKAVLEMISEGVLGNVTEKGNKLVGSALNSTESLISMINDLLFLERMDASGINMELENCDAEKIVSRAIDTVTPEADRKGLSIDMNVPKGIRIDVDAERMNRTLVNLLNNAIKFSPTKARIIVECRAPLSGDNSEVEFRVIDQGPGIPEDKIEVVFERYMQVGTGHEGERKGTGLGLAICKSIVEAHNGKIGVRSVAGQGSTFWFSLPCRQQVRI